MAQECCGEVLFLIVCSSADSSGTTRPWKSAGAAEAVVVAEEVIDR